MRIERALCLVALATFSGVLHAESCAGGVASGMDITGNDCNDLALEAAAPTAFVAAVAAPGVTAIGSPAATLAKAAGSSSAAATARRKVARAEQANGASRAVAPAAAMVAR